ncbi:CSN complex subunit 7 [Aspergillus undulatus]|uniref:CSN complex subunit 7 n=1 Tax=Aspergillus undulatus TaxID=1810928 RepID=UPI003CCE3B49
MDQVHHRALDALQSFIALADSSSASSPRYVANIITNATASPHTYVFAELLEQPSVQVLRSTDTPADLRGYLTLLEIFAWGTWQDYQNTPDLPPLNDQQARKLRLLTLLSLASSVKLLTYDTLMASLSLSAASELESLVTTAIYASLITARLSPATNPPTVNVTAVAPLRDVKPASLPAMISTLTAWETRCGSVISDIEAEIVKIRAQSAQRRTKEHARAVVIEKTLAQMAEAGDAGVTGPGSGGGGGSRRGWKGRDIGAAFRNKDFFGGGSNKREFDDDGYFDDGINDYENSGMDIDEGAGTRTGGGSRQSKRFLGKKS